MRALAAAICLLLLLAFPAAAAPATNGPAFNPLPGLDSPSLTEPNLTQIFLRLMGGLILIVSVFILAAWVFKKSGVLSSYQTGPPQLRVLETRSIGYRQSLMVVSYEQQRFLLSISNNGARLISPLPGSHTAESNPHETPFARQLNIQEGKSS